MAKGRRENGAGTEPKQGVNGRWSLQVSYRDVETDIPGRTTIRRASQGEVIAKRKEFLKSIEAGVKPLASKILFQDWLNEWLEVYKKGEVTNGSLSAYQNVINTHIKESILGKTELVKIKLISIPKILVIIFQT